MLSRLAEFRKGLVTLIGTALTVLTFTHTLTFLPASWITAVGVGIAGLTVVLNVLVPNKPTAS